MNIRTHNSRNGNEGIALVTAMVFIAVAAMVLGGLSLRSVNQNKQVSQYTAFKECFMGVESGAAISLQDVNNGGDGTFGVTNWKVMTQEDKGRIPTFEDELVQPLALATMPRVEYFTYTQDWTSDGVDNNGNGAIDEIGEMGFYTIYAAARNRNVERGAEIVVASEDVNVWRNAIFAGNGQAGGLINGNVSIHGSVHLLGDNLLDGVGALEAIDMSGTSLIHNNYDGLDANLLNRVPALPTTVFDGETVETIEAKVRVRNGLVGMSGNSEIGEAQVSGNSFKETMKGTYVEDGWTGNDVIDDGDRGDPNSVHSDNGWDEGYDLGNMLDLPMLDDDWRDTFTGDTVARPDTGVNYTHREYFEEVLTGTPYPGDVTIQANQDFYYNATRPNDSDPANRQADDDFIYFDAATNQMEINGQIQIDGNLEITRGGGNDKTINYTGRAAILVNGNVTLDTDLYTMNSDGSTANSFPVNNFFGIMAEGDMTVGSLAQLDLMGAFYAQGTVKSVKQTTVMGTFVGSYFDMGTNVPNIFQVPTLADNLVRGLIGYPILFYRQESWREVRV
jgi:hypothetical protein